MGSIISMIFKNQGGKNKDSSKVNKKSGGKKRKRTKETSANKTRRELLKEVRLSRRDQDQFLSEEELLEIEKAQEGVPGPDISATQAGISMQAITDGGSPEEEVLIPEEQMADNLEVPLSEPEDEVDDTPVEESEQEKSGRNIFDMFSDDMEESKASKFAKNLGEVDINDLLNNATSLKNNLSNPED